MSLTSYLDQCLRVRTAILQRPDLLKAFREVFEGSSDACCVGRGKDRMVLDIGDCSLPTGENLVIYQELLTNRNDRRAELDYEPYFDDLRVKEELGAFSAYWDYLADIIKGPSFVSPERHQEYCDKRGVRFPFSLDLSDSSWGGTFIEPGDFGAIPYFHLIVCFQGRFHWLVEGIPSFIQPFGTADERFSDDKTVEKGRVVDLGFCQSMLVNIDSGAGQHGFPIGGLIEGGDLLGLRSLGKQFFLPENRIDLESFI